MPAVFHCPAGRLSSVRLGRDPPGCCGGVRDASSAQKTQTGRPGSGIKTRPALALGAREPGGSGIKTSPERQRGARSSGGETASKLQALRALLRRLPADETAVFMDELDVNPKAGCTW